MFLPVDSKKYGLSSRVNIVVVNDTRFGILKKRKSRIIMKDALQISEIAMAIRNITPNAEIDVIISGPICSKSVNYLKNKLIGVIHEE